MPGPHLTMLDKSGQVGSAPSASAAAVAATSSLAHASNSCCMLCRCDSGGVQGASVGLAVCTGFRTRKQRTHVSARPAIAPTDLVACRELQELSRRLGFRLHGRSRAPPRNVKPVCGCAPAELAVASAARLATATDWHEQGSSARLAAPQRARPRAVSREDERGRKALPPAHRKRARDDRAVQDGKAHRPLTAASHARLREPAWNHVVASARQPGLCSATAPTANDPSSARP